MNTPITKKSIFYAVGVGALAVFTDTQLFIIGIVTTGLVQVIRWIYAAFAQKKLSKRWTLAGVFLVCFGLAYVFGEYTLPVLPILGGLAFVDILGAILGWLETTISVIDEIFLAAVVIYEMVATDLLKAIGDLLTEKLNVKLNF